jgi:hypothetical protein
VIGRAAGTEKVLNDDFGGEPLRTPSGFAHSCCEAGAQERNAKAPPDVDVCEL